MYQPIQPDLFSAPTAQPSFSGSCRDVLFFLDTESTGLQDPRLVELAFKLRSGESFNELYQPPVPITVSAMATHHITNAMVADKPLFASSPAFWQVAELLRDGILVAHNALFDVGVLKNEGLPEPARFICTLAVTRQLFSGLESYNLQYLRYYFNLDVATVNAHRADADVIVLEALFSRLLDQADISDMLSITQQALRPENFLMPFGKYRMKALKQIYAEDPSYLRYLADKVDSGEAGMKIRLFLSQQSPPRE